MKPILILVVAFTLTSCAHHDGSHLHSATPGTQQRSGDIQLDLRTDKPVYRKAESIQITLTTSQTSKVEVYSLDAKGKRTPLWPRPGSAPTFLSPRQTLNLPPANADWKLTAAEPLGTNTLIAKATSAPRPPQTQSSSPEFFQMHTGGWKGMTVEPKTKPAPEHAPQQKRSGEVRWLYEVRK